MLSETFVLALLASITSSYATYLKYKGPKDLASIKSREQYLKEKLEDEEKDNVELRIELEEADREIHELEEKNDRLQAQCFEMELKAQEWKLIVIKALQKANIDEEHFDLLIEHLKNQ